MDVSYTKGSEAMVFNTGAALLDAIVLAVVSQEEEGTYGYKITQDVRKVIEISESTLYRCFVDYKRTSVWKYMISSMMEGTAVITRRRRKASLCWNCTGQSG